MTVQELIVELENYGGHLPVRIIIPASSEVGTLQKRDDDVFMQVEVDDIRTVHEEGVQALILEPSA